MNLLSLFKPSALTSAPLETLRQILQQCENEGVMDGFALTRCRELGMPIVEILAEQIAKNDEGCRELVKTLVDARQLLFSKVVDALRHPFMQSWLCGIHAPRCRRCGYAHALPHCEQCWNLIQPNVTPAQFKAQLLGADEWDRKSTFERDDRDAETLLKLCQLSMPPLNAERFEERTGFKLKRLATLKPASAEIEDESD